uniref:Uncharacterized protein n=1 Tax=viral metagenome TaxID=1070528 RepID=A0A6C0C8B9_9ZZZZ
MFQIDIFYIFVGLCVGFFIVYVTSPPPKIVIKYPTLENIKDTTYIDEKGQCYKYYSKEIKCNLSDSS